MSSEEKIRRVAEELEYVGRRKLELRNKIAQLKQSNHLLTSSLHHTHHQLDLSNTLILLTSKHADNTTELKTSLKHDHALLQADFRQKI
jgi:hypothetical protein